MEFFEPKPCVLVIQNIDVAIIELNLFTYIKVGKPEVLRRLWNEKSIPVFYFASIESSWAKRLKGYNGEKVWEADAGSEHSQGWWY